MIYSSVRIGEWSLAQVRFPPVCGLEPDGGATPRSAEADISGGSAASHPEVAFTCSTFCTDRVGLAADGRRRPTDRRRGVTPRGAGRRVAQKGGDGCAVGS